MTVFLINHFLRFRLLELLKTKEKNFTFEITDSLDYKT